MSNNQPGYPALIIILAVAVLAGLSLLPLHEWTGGVVKEFNLLSDVMHDLSVEADSTAPDPDEVFEDIDPELLRAQAEAESGSVKVNPRAGSPVGLHSGPSHRSSDHGHFSFAGQYHSGKRHYSARTQSLTRG